MGCVHLQHAILGYWPHAFNLGTLICRPTADGAPSVHGNGRAGDDGDANHGPTHSDLVQEMADWLVANHTVLGVQLVIANHKIWNVSRAAEGWRPYGCDDPGSKKDHHVGHVHWEINVDAGEHLTTATIATVAPHQPPPAPALEQPQEADDMPRIVHSGGAIFAVGFDFGTFTDVNGVTRTGPWRRTFENPAQLEQHIGGRGYVTQPHPDAPAGVAFDVTIPHDVFEQVYGDLGRVQP
jgi:hypothetical protein